MVGGDKGHGGGVHEGVVEGGTGRKRCQLNNRERSDGVSDIGLVHLYCTVQSVRVQSS